MDFDGPALDSLRIRAKRQIRQRMRTLRSAVPAGAREIRSALVRDRLLALPEMAEARRVALFWPILEKGEVDLRPVDAVLRTRNVEVFYPFVQRKAGSTAGFARTLGAGDLVDLGNGFLEPKETAPVASAAELDVIVVPALAVAASGHRLGYGAGFYDRVLPVYRPPATAVIVAFEFQLLAELPVSDGDVPGDVVVTDRRVIRVEAPVPAPRAG